MSCFLFAFPNSVEGKRPSRGELLNRKKKSHPGGNQGGAGGVSMRVSSTRAPGVSASYTEYTTVPVEAEASAGLFCAPDGVKGYPDATQVTGGVARRVRPGAAAAGGGLGLSNAHIWPLVSATSGTVEVWIGGTLVKVKGAGLRKRQGGGRRGLCGPFSRGSRLRMLQLLAKLLQVRCLFATLTYGEYSIDCKDWKRDKAAFERRLKRKFPAAGWIWRLESQRRGAPHYHLLIFGVDWIECGWLARTWYEVVGSNNPNHLQAGTSIERVKGDRAVGRYVGKYLGKMPNSAELPDGLDWEHVGRWWGVRYAECIPWAECLRGELTEREGVRLLRFVGRYLSHVAGLRRRVGCASAFLFMDGGLFWGALPQLIC